MAKSFEELECWKEAVELDGEVYEFVMNCEIRNLFSLRDQMLGASGSVGDNIAEGFERGGNKELIQFLFISKGSCGELRSQFHRCKRRKLISDTDFSRFYDQCISVSKKIGNFINYL